MTTYGVSQPRLALLFHNKSKKQKNLMLWLQLASKGAIVRSGDRVRLTESDFFKTLPRVLPCFVGAELEAKRCNNNPSQLP